MLKKGQGLLQAVNHRLAGRQKISRFVGGADLVGGGSFRFIPESAIG